MPSSASCLVILRFPMGKVKIQEAEKLLISDEAKIHSPALKLQGPSSAGSSTFHGSEGAIRTF